MRRYALRDDQWDRIKDFLPGREGPCQSPKIGNKSWARKRRRSPRAVTIEFRSRPARPRRPARPGHGRAREHALD
jgi:hypothetical protein